MFTQNFVYLINPIEWPETIFLGIHTLCALCLAHMCIKIQMCPDDAQVLRCIAWHRLAHRTVSKNLTRKHPDLLLNSSLCGQMIKVTRVTRVSLRNISLLQQICCVHFKRVLQGSNNQWFFIKCSVFLLCGIFPLCLYAWIFIVHWLIQVLSVMVSPRHVWP